MRCPARRTRALRRRVPQTERNIIDACRDHHEALSASLDALIPGLRLDARLHGGRFVDVWRACAPCGTLAAVKLRSFDAVHPGIDAWLRREHAVLSSFDHPAIVRCIGLAQGADDCALVMEYLGGGDLIALAGAATEHWVPAAVAVTRALQKVHARGLAHGDIKARNVLIACNGQPDQQAKLIDFGSALAFGSARTVPAGTVAHQPRRFALLRAAPEEDVYALAVMLYELLMGRLPFADVGANLQSPDWPNVTEPLLAPLVHRVMATLVAERLSRVGTLSEYVDVLESIQRPLADRRCMQ